MKLFRYFYIKGKPAVKVVATGFGSKCKPKSGKTNSTTLRTDKCYFILKEMDLKQAEETIGGRK